MPRTVRLRVMIELLDEHGQVVIAAPTDTFVQGSRLSELEDRMARGQFLPLDADNTMVAQTAFNLCRDSYRRMVDKLMNKGEAA